MTLAASAALGIAALALFAGSAKADPVDWSADVGAIGRVRPTHLGADRYTEDVFPILEAKIGDRLQISLDDGVKWTAAKAGWFSVGPVAEYRQSFDDDLPRGAFKTHDAVELGGFAQAVWSSLGEVEARLRHAVNGYAGWSGDLSYDAGGPLTPRLKLLGELRLAWADSNFSEEYFGLRPHASRRFGLPTFLTNDYKSIGGQVAASRDLTPKMGLVLSVSEDRIVGEEFRSPLLKDRNVAIAAIGFVFHFSSAQIRRSTSMNDLKRKD